MNQQPAQARPIIEHDWQGDELSEIDVETQMVEEPLVIPVDPLYARLTVDELRDLTAMVYGAPLGEQYLQEQLAIVRTYERLRSLGLRPWDPSSRNSELAFRIAADPWAQQVDQVGGQH